MVALADLAVKTGYKSTRSLEFMRALVNFMQPACVLELGTAFGASAAYMASALDTGKVITVDNYSGMYASSEDEIRAPLVELGVADRVVLLHGDTHESGLLMRRAGFRKAKPELIFMDADHSYDGLQAEYEGCELVRAKHHVVVIDDLFLGGLDVHRFTCEMSRHYEFTLMLKGFHWGLGVLATNDALFTKVTEAIKSV